MAWERRKLGEIAYLAGRIGWKGLTAKEYTKSGPLFTSVHALNHGDYVDFSDAFHISQARFDESPEIMLAVNDVLICKDGAGIGKLGIVGNLPGPATINSSLLLIRALPGVDPKFLYRALCSPIFQRIVQERIDGATTPHLYQREIQQISVPVPPLPEQTRIVAILDEAFEGIDAAIANTERNRANARELFGSYLQHAFRDQEGWEERTLQQVSRLFGRGKSRHRPRNDPSLYDGPYPFIQTGEVRNCNHVILESSQTYNERGLAQSKLWPRGTVCITIAANIAETGILGFDACFPDSIIGMVPDENKTTSDFVEYLLQATKTQLKAQGKGSAQDNINVATFENRSFLFPPLPKQMEIADTLNALSDRVQQLEAVFGQKLVRLAELKQAILRKAFAGELTAHPEKALQEAAE